MSNDDKVKKKSIYKKKNQKEKKDDDFIEEVSDSKETSKTTFNLVEVIIIMVVTILFGLLIGSFISYSRFRDDRDVSCSAIRNDMVEFASIYDDLLNDYYGDVDKDELLEAAIEGMVNYLDDPYSAYIEKSDALEFSEELEGSFSGIGVEIKSFEGELPVVSKVFDDSPAFHAGIEVGDIFFEINDSSLEGLSVFEIADIIKVENAGNEMKLSVLRDDVEMNFMVSTALIEIESVSGFVESRDDKKIGVIEISTFAKNSYNQFVTVYESLESQDIDSLIIDVRGNTGGYLSVAKEIASLFLDKGAVIYQKDTDGNIEKIVSEKDKKINVPVLFIVDGGTASAAEVLVSALKENLGSIVLGVNTYGKGTIQKLHPLSNGAYVKYTAQIWLTSSGNKIEGLGITPDYIVEQNSGYYDFPSDENDSQLQEAYNILIK